MPPDFFPDDTASTRRASSSGFFVGEWFVEPGRNCIRKNGRQHRLEPKTMALLVYLADRSEQTVSRDELLDAVWGVDTFVTENTLSRTVSRLRKALEDDWQHPTYLETISKSGYRLIAPVSGPGEIEGERLLEHQRLAGPARFWRRGLPLAAAAALVAVALILLTAVSSPEVAGDASPGEMVPSPAATLVGSQVSSRLSPDGGRIAFSWAGVEGDDLDLYVKQVDSEDLLRITSQPGFEGYPAWSADGNSIAYLHGDQTEAAIYVVAAIGGAPRLLGATTPQARDLSWNPDGRRIVYSDIGSASEVRSLFELDVETGRSRILTSPQLAAGGGDRKPSVSPDGTSVAFSRRRARTDQLFILDLETLEETPLSELEGAEVRGHDWTADGRAVVYSSNRGGHFALWRTPLDGSETTRLPIHDQWITEPSLARSANRLIYRKFSDVVNIWSVQLDERFQPTGPRTRRVPSTRTEFQPAVSPDGRRLAFVSNRSGTFEVWSSDLETARTIRHTHLDGPIPSNPAWSPDGTRLVFDSSASGNGDLYEVGHDSGVTRRLTDDPSDELNATFSPDGQWLYFTSNRSGQWQIWRMPAAGGEAVQMTEQGGFYARQDPAGEFLYLAHADGALWRQSLVGGADKQLGRMHPYDWAAWDLVGRAVFFVRRSPVSIAAVRGEAMKMIPVLEPANNLPYMGANISLTAGGTHLYYAEIEQSDDEVLIVDF